MKFILLTSLLCSFQALASYPEMFGASFSTTYIGNQANLDANDPSNNYYAPAVLGFSDKVNVLIQATSTATHFKPMNNIVVTNNTNSSSTTYGNVSNRYQKFHGGSLHFALPIGYQHLGTLGLSFYLPLGHLMETNSGDPFLPEYIMYHSRHQRASIYVNFARKFSEDFAWSLGTIVGFQASAEARTNLSLNGGTKGSWGKAQSKITPSLGVIASAVKKFEKAKVYFAYQQEMKSNLKANVFGEVVDPSLPLFEADIDTMIFYDPHTIRLGSSFKTGDSEFYTGVEYQMWSGYKTPSIRIKKTGGAIVSSTNYENLKIRDTINPRVGYALDLTDRWKWGLGFGYRMSPLKGDFSGSGNSIDTNTQIFTTGLQYRIVIWSKDVKLGTAFEYQKLEKKHVSKTTGQENGSAGSKIGAGGYDIDGYVIAATLGVKFNF